MRKQIHKLALFIFFILFFTEEVSAYTFDWKGTTSTAWNNAANWTRSGSGGTSTYPGQSGFIDVVKIGVTAYASNQPNLTASVSVASMEFGNNSGASMTFTINTGVVLTVISGVIQDHNNSNSGIATTITGTGTAELDCASFTVGDATIPPTPSGDVLFGGGPFTNTTTLNCNIPVLSISGNLALNSTSSPLGSYTAFFIFPASNYSVNNPLFNLNSGTITAANIITTNSNYVNTTDADGNTIKNTATYQMDLGASTNTLNLLGATPLTIGLGGAVDFVSGGTVTASTVNYAATAGTQKVYSSSDGGIGSSPTIYPNLNLSATSAKTVDAGTLSVGAAWSTSGGAVNLNTNSARVTVAGSWTNSATVTQGSGNISITGTVSNTGTLTLGSGSLTITGNYTNNGTYIQSTGNTVFNGSAQTLNDGGSGTMFNAVTFNGGSTDIINSGNFSVSATGILTMSGTTILNANGHLTLNSTATSSATIAAIPATASITGNVSVQRYITGGTIAYRGYRLLSSQVYNGADTHGNNAYSINYLKNSIFITATTTAGGFDNPSAANPSLYLYRENMTPAYTTYLNSNFRSINNINSSPSYTLDVDGAGFYIPSGNGYLCFFRGNRSSTSYAAETVTTYVPQTVTLSTSGTLNQGQITVKDWFTPTLSTLSYTIASPATVKGYNLVGNPYASSIDWENFQTASTTTGIYGTSGATGVSNTIWVLDPISHNYGAYVKGGGGVGTNNASNIIASGQGFFVVVGATADKLIFNEGAKTNTQVTNPKLLMGVPTDQTANSQYLRLQLAKDTIDTDDMLIRFNNTAGTVYSPAVDAPYKQGFGEVSISSLSSDHVPLAISVQPLPKTSETIRLNVTTSANGIYKLNMKKLVGIPQLFDVWLMDAYKKDSLNMRDNPAYSFNVIKSDTNSYGSKRFSLVIRQNPAYAYHLLSFNASKAATTTATRQVQIVWATENEQNYTNFTVERSTDNGKTYEVVGGVSGSAQGTYSLLDSNPAEQNLYRLKQEDINDGITYSKIIPIAYSALSNNLVNNNINVYPNPASNIINLAIEKGASNVTSYNIMITTSTGLLIKQATSVQSTWQSNVSELQPGTYIVKVINNTDQSMVGNTKFVKE